MSGPVQGPGQVMGHDERKHWSKACAALLRHNTMPPNEREFENVVSSLRSSRRFGPPTSAKIWEAVQGNHRFATRSVQQDEGWTQWYLRAV
jgi:hypothetical protein